MKKLTSLLLAALFILSTLAGCASGDSGTQDTTAPSDTTAPADTTTEAATTEPEILPDVPADKKYEGFQFKVLTSDEVNTIRSSFEIEAEQNGEVMNDAVYKRNLAVNEALGVTVKHLKGAYASQGWIKDFRNAVSAGDDSYDILVADQTYILQNSAAYGADVSSLPYVDLSKPWWDEKIISSTALAGKTFGLTGDINLVDDGAAWGIMFNKDFAVNHGINVDDLYQLVRDGKWTLDKFEEYCAKASKDVNGDGVYDSSDEWGVCTSGTAVHSMLYSSGGLYASLDKDSKPVVAIDTEKNMTVLNRLYDFLHNGHNCVTAGMVPTNGKADFNKQRSIFIEGRALFIQGTICYIPLYLRDMQDDFGVLPNPKWDEEQDDYISTAQEWAASMWMAPRSGGDLERTSIILEVMSYHSGKTIVPAYFDELLTRKSTRDEQSVEMLQLILDSRTAYDLAMAYNWGKLQAKVSSWLEAGSNTLASSIAADKNTINTDALNEYQAVITAVSDAAK